MAADDPRLLLLSFSMAVAFSSEVHVFPTKCSSHTTW